jgi:hypothetical protein
MDAATPFPLEELFCDPRTGERLRRVDDRLVSSRASFPIVNGIPRFVDKDAYAESFSFEWNRHAATQLDAFRGDDSSERQFRAKTGFAPGDLAGKLVLDAGASRSASPRPTSVRCRSAPAASTPSSRSACCTTRRIRAPTSASWCRC